MSVATLKRRVAVLVATPIAASGLMLAGAVWSVASVSDRPTHNSLDIAVQESGDRDTGPLGSAHISNDDGWRTTGDNGWRTTGDNGWRTN